MKAIITGASSGIGFEMAKVLSEKGYDIIAVAIFFNVTTDYLLGLRDL